MSPLVANPAAGGRLGALTFWGLGPGRNGRTLVADINYREFGPRLGLSYQLSNKTALRASYGIDYYPNAGGAFAAGFQLPNFGFGAQVTKGSPDNGITPLLYWDNGINLIPPLPNLNPSLFNGISVPMLNAADSQLGRAQLLGAAVEREVGWSTVLRAEYVGKLLHGMIANSLARYNDLPLQYLSLGNLLNNNINSPQAVAAGIPFPYAGFAGTVAQALRRYPQYQNVAQVMAPNSYSLYHAVLLSAQKRFSNSLSFLISDTIGKILTPSDNFAGGAQGATGGVIQHAAFLNQAKMVAPWDVAQQFKVSYSYDLPVGRGRALLKNANPVLDAVLGGWTIAGIHVYNGGAPIVVTGRQSIPGVGGVWPLQVLGVPILTGLGCGNVDINNPTRNAYLNASAFKPPAPLTFGNVRVLSSTRGCGYLSEDISLLKGFRIAESVSLKVGADFFDAFNRHQWAGLITDTENPAFGRYTSATGATPAYAGAAPGGRSIQLHMKLEF